MEWLSSLFLGTFFVGLLFCVGSALLGFGQTGLDDLGFSFGGHGADGLDGLDGADGGHVSGHVSPWNLTGLTAFVAWFGGVGYLALENWQLVAWLSVALAVLGGLVGWGVIYWFYARVLVRGETRMDPADYRLEGTVAKVTTRLNGDRLGEIQFSKAGTRRSEGARSEDGTTLERGAEVVIVRYERGIAYVQPWAAYVEPEAPEGRREG